MPITLGTHLLLFQHFQNLYSRGLKIWKYPWHRHNAGQPSLSQWEPLPTYHPMISPYNTQTDTGAKYRHSARQRGKIQTQVQNTDTQIDRHRCQQTGIDTHRLNYRNQCTMRLSPFKSCIKEIWLNASLSLHFPSV